MITKLSDLNPETLENLHMALANATEEMIGDKTIAEAAKENDALCRLLSIEHACFEALSQFNGDEEVITNNPVWYERESDSLAGYKGNNALQLKHFKIYGIFNII